MFVNNLQCATESSRALPLTATHNIANPFPVNVLPCCHLCFAPQRCSETNMPHKQAKKNTNPESNARHRVHINRRGLNFNPKKKTRRHVALRTTRRSPPHPVRISGVDNSRTRGWQSARAAMTRKMRASPRPSHSNSTSD